MNSERSFASVDESGEEALAIRTSGIRRTRLYRADYAISLPQCD